ncbi:MAG: PP2C family protein-serine/threonine phosphatase [Candidatus Fimenecus sp.]
MCTNQIRAVAVSDVGKRRTNNEDNYFINGQTVGSAMQTSASAAPSAQNVFAVFDGMGGEQAGELASQAAADVFCADALELLQSGFSYPAVNALVQKANHSICALARQKRARVGTTLALLAFREDNILIANVGDSRVYRLSDGILTQLSKDHTQAQFLVDSGVLPKEEAEKRPEKHKLTQHLGIFPEEMEIEPYVVTVPAVQGERFLLCSDGLTDMLQDSEIQQILRENLPIETVCRRLVQTALDRGGKDNTTVVLCEIISSDSKRGTTQRLDTASTENEGAVRNAAPVANKENRPKKRWLWGIIGIVVLVTAVAVAVFGLNLKDGNLSERLHREPITTVTETVEE